jgi:hypothetical protein
MEGFIPKSADRILGIDWSGAATPSKAQIYIAEVVRGEGAQLSVRALVRANDRDAVKEFLAGDCLAVKEGWEKKHVVWPKPPADDETVLAGLDFAFGFPASFELPGVGVDWTRKDLVDWCAEIDKAESLDKALAKCDVARRQFRGIREVKDGPVEATKRATEDAAEEAGHKPESVLVLVGERQVGRGSIRGIPIIDRLQEKHDAAIWPIEDVKTRGLTLVEVFPRVWLDAPGSKTSPPVRLDQVRKWKREKVCFENDTEWWAVASPDALDAVAAALGLARLDALTPPPLSPDILAREGWIAGIYQEGAAPKA